MSKGTVVPTLSPLSLTRLSFSMGSEYAVIALALTPWKRIGFLAVVVPTLLGWLITKPLTGVARLGDHKTHCWLAAVICAFGARRLL